MTTIDQAIRQQPANIQSEAQKIVECGYYKNLNKERVRRELEAGNSSQYEKCLMGEFLSTDLPDGRKVHYWTTSPTQKLIDVRDGKCDPSILNAITAGFLLGSVAGLVGTFFVAIGCSGEYALKVSISRMMATFIGGGALIGGILRGVAYLFQSKPNEIELPR